VIFYLELVSMDGILNINKPPDITSFSVVAAVKRITGERHAGHAGTLDPLATGVLPVCLGQATRVIEYLFGATKTYRAEVEFGKTTDTYDSTGKTVRTGDASGLNPELIEAALVKFRGPIRQTPPMYSAVKHQGQPLYKLARSGVEVERKSRPAHIYSLEITGWHSPVVTLEVVCGKGTYIRSLAYDLGEALGCGANMKSLVRLKVGPFTIEDAVTLPKLEEARQQGSAQKYLYPIDFVLLPFSAIVVDHEQQCSLIHGASISLETGLESPAGSARPDYISRVYTQDGSFLGMVKFDSETKLWHPEKIFLQKCCER
jgi:tRNA pseudouridine55 synthase